MAIYRLMQARSRNPPSKLKDHYDLKVDRRFLEIHPETPESESDPGALPTGRGSRSAASEGVFASSLDLRPPRKSALALPPRKAPLTPPSSAAPPRSPI